MILTISSFASFKKVTSFSPYKIKIFDFATSHMMSDTNIHTNVWRGNIRWQPPEVCQQLFNETHLIEHPTKIDIYSFGMFLWELVTARIPYFEHQDDITSIAKVIINGDIPEIPGDAPPQYTNIILSCVEMDPTKRPAFVQLKPTFQELDIHGPQLELLLLKDQNKFLNVVEKV